MNVLDMTKLVQAVQTSRATKVIEADMVQRANGVTTLPGAWVYAVRTATQVPARAAADNKAMPATVFLSGVLVPMDVVDTVPEGVVSYIGPDGKRYVAHKADKADDIRVPIAPSVKYRDRADGEFPQETRMYDLLLAIASHKKAEGAVAPTPPVDLWMPNGVSVYTLKDRATRELVGNFMRPPTGELFIDGPSGREMNKAVLAFGPKVEAPKLGVGGKPMEAGEREKNRAAALAALGTRVTI